MDMDDKTVIQWETQVRETAVRLAYPPTPDLVDAVQPAHMKAKQQADSRYRLAWVVVVLALLAGLFLVPQVRAAVWRILRAGAITIFVTEPTPMPTTTAGDDLSEMQPMMPPTATPRTFTPYISDQGVAVSLQEAQASMRHPVQLPSNLGMPDQFYLDNAENPTMLVSLWLDEVDKNNAQYSLYQIEVFNLAAKGANFVSPATVDGHEAFWVEGPHVIRLEDGRFQSWLFVEGNVLIWWEGELTFRLEGAATLEEAVALAESLEPVSTQ